VYDRHGHLIKDPKLQAQTRAPKVTPNAVSGQAAALLALQQTAGNRAARLTLMRDPAGPMSPVTDTAVTDTGEVDISMKDDAILARGIVEGEQGILRQWRDTLLIFDKTMVSESDEAGKPDFKKAALQFFADTVIDSLLDITQLPGLPKGVPQPGKALYGLLQKLEAEYKRAGAAQESARLRDFFNTHIGQIAEIDRQLTLAKDDFEAAVGLVAGKVGANDQANSDYAMMRLRLVEQFQSVERRLAETDTSTLYTRLSEQWIRASTIPIGMGLQANARVIIRLETDFSVRNGHIQGTGGQKLAEQLLKNSPDGIDLYHMAVPRTIIRYAENGWPRDILRLDANGRRDDMNNFAEGNPTGVYNWIAKNGMPRIKKVSGD